MTNLQAYMAYCPENDIAMLTLGSYAIDPAGIDANTASAALGMIDMALRPDYSQGQTSEKISDKTRSYLISRAKAMLKSVGVEYIDGGSGVIINARQL